MAVLHELRLVHDGVLQTGPYLALQLVVRQPQARAQVVYADHREAVEL